MIVFLILLTLAVIGWSVWYISNTTNTAKDDSPFAPYKLKVDGTEFTVIPQPEGQTLPVFNLAPAIEVLVKKPRKPRIPKVVVPEIAPVKKPAAKKPAVKDPIVKKLPAKPVVKKAAAMSSKKK